MKCLVTGAAGFIGSNFCDYLLSLNNQVLGLDNLSTGRDEFLIEAIKNKNFKFIKTDLTEFEKTKTILSDFKPDIVVHLAANADVRFGLQHPRKDLEQGTTVTFNVLEAARLAGAKKFAYSSTGSVYGEPEVFPTPEVAPFPVQTSLYAASKLAGEAMISAYAEGYGIKGYVFRFVSILGKRYTHGHVYDFINKLKANPDQIDILGDGKQQKAYLHVDDCVRAMWLVLTKKEDKINIFNLGPDEYIDVDRSLDVICSKLKVDPKRSYSGGKRGWVGDSPFIFLDCKKLKNLGWKAEKSIKDSVALTVDYLLENDWVLAKRKS